MKNLKPVLTISFLLFLNSNVCGQQQWAQPGALWYYGIGDNSAWGSSGYVEIRKVGDTIFNGINCDVLTFHFDFVQNWPGGTPQNYYAPNRYTYISNDTVYLNYGNTFETLFLTSSPPGNYWITGPDEYGICAGDTIEVDSLQVVTLSGITMNRIVPVPLDMWPTFPAMPPTISHNAPFYERFGSIGYFFPLAVCVTDFAAGPLCYYSDSSGFVYSNMVSPYCDNVPTGLTTINSDNNPTLYPTITNSQLTVNIPFVDIYKDVVVELFDMNGKNLERYFIFNKLTELDVTFLSEGIYICRIIQNNQTFNLKFIKTEY